VAEDESDRISGSKSKEVEAVGDKIISETGRTPRRGVGRRDGAWTPDERKRRNRFAFSRGPASFLMIESRRLRLGKSSLSMYTVCADRVSRLDIDSPSNGVPVKLEGGVGLLDADREENCAGKGIMLAPIILMISWASLKRPENCSRGYVNCERSKLGHNKRLK
jgi:hypothetical protein